MSILNITADEYHADNVGTNQPTLSASIAKILLTESPAHAKARHPKLTDKPVVRDEAKHLDLGQAVHSMLLEQDHSNITVLDHPDWRTNHAKTDRDIARTAGHIPMLRHQYEQAVTITETARERIEQLDVTPVPFTDGTAETTIVWQEPNGIMCRSRLDWLSLDNRTIDDLKTSARSVNPHGVDRTLFSMGYDIAAAFYLRGVKAVTGTVATFRWVMVETNWPHAVSMLTLGPDALAIAEAKVERAISMWADCLASGVWPAYPARLCTVEAPGWAEAQWLEQEALRAAL